MRRLFLFLLLVGPTFIVPTASSAKGTTARTIVTITGPGLDTELVATEPVIVNLLTLPMLADLYGAPVGAPVHADTTYLLTRYAIDDAGIHALGSMRYYLPEKGSGTVIYRDTAVASPGQFAGHWFPASIPSAQLVRCFLANHGMRLGQRTSSCPPWAQHWLSEHPD